MYKAELNTKPQGCCLTIGLKEGRPTILSVKLEQKLRAILTNMRILGQELMFM